MRIYTVRVFFCSIILVNENKWLPLLNKNACIRKNIQCYMEVKRDLYLNKLIRSMHNGMIKVVTGIRRCGKSYLLFNLFSDYLKSQGVDDEHIIKVDLEDRRNKNLRNPDALLEYIDTRIARGDALCDA